MLDCVRRQVWSILRLENDVDRATTFQPVSLTVCVAVCQSDTDARKSTVNSFHQYRRAHRFGLPDSIVNFCVVRPCKFLHRCRCRCRKLLHDPHLASRSGIWLIKGLAMQTPDQSCHDVTRVTVLLAYVIIPWRLYIHKLLATLLNQVVAVS